MQKKARNIQATLECFIEKDGKFLMLHRSDDKKIMPGVWMAPGGRREHAEGLFEAAKREVEEETGLEIKNLRIRATGVAYLKDLDTELYFHFVKAELAGGELHSECDEGAIEWLTQDEILAKKSLSAVIREVLEYVVDESLPVVSCRAVYERGNEMVDFEIENAW